MKTSDNQNWQENIATIAPKHTVADNINTQNNIHNDSSLANDVHQP